MARSERNPEPVWVIEVLDRDGQWWPYLPYLNLDDAEHVEKTVSKGVNYGSRVRKYAEAADA